MLSSSKHENLFVLVGSSQNFLPGGFIGFLVCRAHIVRCSGLGDIQLPANAAHRSFFHLAVPGYGSDLAGSGILPERVVSALALQVAALFPQVPLQISELHTGASSN